MKSSRLVALFLMVLVVAPIPGMPVAAIPDVSHSAGASPSALSASKAPFPASTLSAQTALAKAGGGGAMFIENVGQFAPGARFQVRGGGHTLWLAEDSLWITVVETPTVGMAMPRRGEEAGQSFLPEGDITSPASSPLPARGTPPPRGAVHLKLSFVGANPQPRLEPLNRLETHVSYFIGGKADDWHADVPVWGGVRYADLYPGIDLELAAEGGRVTQRLVVRDEGARHAVPLRDVRLRVEGADSLALEGEALRVQTAVGEFTLPLLEAVDAAGALLAPAGRPALEGLEVANPLVPPRRSPESTTLAPRAGASDLLYATFLGGGDQDQSWGIAVDNSRRAYVTGLTESGDFPAARGPGYDTGYNGDADAVVVALEADGMRLCYATFLGGSRWDEGWGIAVDGLGRAYVTGQTWSGDFPAAQGLGYDTVYNGGVDAFVVSLEAAGTALRYATFLGGSGYDYGDGIAVDGLGRAYVTGQTWSGDFPAAQGPGYDTVYNGGEDAFVVALDATGTAIVYGTYLGGSSDEHGEGIAVDVAGRAYVTGGTWSTDFPTTPGAFDRSFRGGVHNYYGDVFVAVLDRMGTALVYGTFLGGSGGDWGGGIAVDGVGRAYVTGETSSADFPTTPGAFDDSYNGGVHFESDVFVAVLDPSRSTLVYSTFLGGSGDDGGGGIAVNGGGRAHVTGYTGSADWPTTPEAFDRSYGGGTYDAFAAALDATGSVLAYSTFLGGSGDDVGQSIAVDALGRAYVNGDTRSADLSTTREPYDRSYNGSGDAFLVKLAAGSVSYAILLPLALRR